MLSSIACGGSQVLLGGGGACIRLTYSRLSIVACKTLSCSASCGQGAELLWTLKPAWWREAWTCRGQVGFAVKGKGWLSRQRPCRYFSLERHALFQHNVSMTTALGGFLLCNTIKCAEGACLKVYHNPETSPEAGNAGKTGSYPMTCKQCSNHHWSLPSLPPLLSNAVAMLSMITVDA